MRVQFPECQPQLIPWRALGCKQHSDVGAVFLEVEELDILWPHQWTTGYELPRDVDSQAHWFSAWSRRLQHPGTVL